MAKREHEAIYREKFTSARDCISNLEVHCMTVKFDYREIAGTNSINVDVWR